MITNLIEYFEKTVNEFNTDKTAVIDNDKEYSFGFIKDRAKKLSSFLLSCNTADYNKPAAVFLDKSVNVIISNIAAMYSCMPYMNMDTKTPLYRISNIIEQVNPVFIITNSKYEEKIKEIYSGHIINIDDFDFNISIDDEKIIRHLRHKKLIEGRKPYLHISEVIAQVSPSEKRAQYILEKGQEISFYEQQIIDFLRLKPSQRHEIENLLLKQLSTVLSTEQKKRKIGNILLSLKRKNKIRCKGMRKAAIWEAV